MNAEDGPAWKTARQRAEIKVTDILGGTSIASPLDEAHAETIVDEVIEILKEPDRDMLAVGVAEISMALPPGTTQGYRRNLVAAIWRAMIGRAG